MTLTRGRFQTLAVLEERPSLLVFRHVLEHLDDPRSFLTNLRATLADPDCGWYCEVPDARFTFEESGIWDLLYEHCSYFGPVALQTVFARAGLAVVRTQRRFQGQFLSVEARSGTTSSAPTLPVQSLRALDHFKEAYTNKVESWRLCLREWRRRGDRVALWGAGTKGVMFLHTADCESAVAQVVDVSPRKWGTFVPGTGHEIGSPQSLVDFAPDRVLVMNSSYQSEIAAELQRLGLEPQLRTV